MRSLEHAQYFPLPGPEEVMAFASSALDDLEGIIREKIETYEKLSTYLQDRHPSIRSLKRFCNGNSIRNTSRLTMQELDRVVSEAIEKVSC